MNISTLDCTHHPNRHPGDPTGRPNRRSIRLKDYDYTQPGAYFITAVTRGRECLFGEVVDGEMRLNDYGEVVRACWLEIPHHFTNVELDEFVVMPNHVHGIVFLVEDAAGASGGAMPQRPLPQPGPPSRSVGAIVGSFKSAATRRINQHRNSPGAPIWHRKISSTSFATRNLCNAYETILGTIPAGGTWTGRTPAAPIHTPH